MARLYDRRETLIRIGALGAAAAGQPLLASCSPAATNAGGALTVVRPEDPSFNEKLEGFVWNALKPNRRPAQIVEIQNEQNIIDALAAARSAGKRVSMVSSGHNYIGNGVRDGAVLLDLSGLAAIEVDAANKRATVQCAARSFDFDAALDEHGLAFPVPHNPGVGLGGYILGGGMGWNAESWNDFACFNLTAVDVITASGEKITADERNHSDLFWAARGAGPNFPGVVTHFHVNVFSRPQAILETTYVYPIEALDRVAAWLDQVHPAQSPKLELVAILATPEEGPGAGTAWQCIVSAVHFADTEQEARTLLATFVRGRPNGEVFKEELAPRTIRDLLLKDKADLPIRHYVETMWTDNGGQTLRQLAQQVRTGPAHTLAYVNYRAHHTLSTDAAYSRVAPAFSFIDCAWENASDDERVRTWLDGAVAAFSATDRGCYINETEYIHNPARGVDAYAPDRLDRLKAVIEQYDPHHLFVSPINS